MRRSHRTIESAATQVNLTPLIDMVFILLIFFIVTASFVKEAGIDVNRPTAKTTVRKERGNIIIAISAKGEIWIDKHQVDMRSVRAHVERLKAENPEGAVVILGDKDANLGVAVQIMDQARLAGVANVSIAASKDTGG